MLTPAEIAAALRCSTRQIQRLTAAGLPCTPTGARGKTYDLEECKAWLRANPTCLSPQRQRAATKSLSASAVSDFTAACRRAQLRVMPSTSSQS